MVRVSRRALALLYIVLRLDLGMLDDLAWCMEVDF